MAKTIQQLAADAIQVQDASNILGVSRSFAQAVLDLRDVLTALGEQTGTDDIAYHPITKLWASKLHQLARMGPSDYKRYDVAYDECKRLAALPVAG